MGRGSMELIEYRAELSSIIGELEKVEFHVRHDFKNVGNEKCADSIQSVISKYRDALNTLNSIDASTLDTLKSEAEKKAAEAARIAKEAKAAKLKNSSIPKTSKNLKNSW